jgi:hypothetical protein
MKKRLFTIGCSFTRYYWPTWADILGREYDEFENWGLSGIGNRAIVEKLSECVINNNITEHDTIIIQWSEIHRFDVHMSLPHLPEGWGQIGNILTSGGPYEGWLKKYWSERSYIMHTLNFVHLAQRLLSTLSCQWYMFSLNDFWEDFDINPEFKNYREVLEHPRFLGNMNSWFSQYDFPKITLKSQDGKVEVDEHPIPIAHYGWVHENLCPILGKTVDEAWVQKSNQILFDHCRTYEESNDIYIKHLNWSPFIHSIKGVIDTEYSNKKHKK